MRYLVVGAAKSGVAAANFLAAQGETVALYDAKSDPSLPYELHDAVVRIFGNDGDAVLDGVETIVVSPGVPLTVPILMRASAQRIPITVKLGVSSRRRPSVTIS